jgi:LacI family transcriptional regulator
MLRIKDIAKEANVSEGTVDRVLHNRGGVSSKTEAKIKKILEKRNFSVNPIASALAMQNKHNIAVLIPQYSDTDTFWKSPYLGILKATEDVKNMGIQISSFQFDEYSPISYLEAFNELLETNPKMVLLVPMFLKETKQIVAELETLEIAYMFLNIDIDDFKNIAYVGQDSYAAGYIAGKLMHLNAPEAGAFLVIQTRDHIGDNYTISKRINGFNDYFTKNKVSREILILKIENLNSTLNIKDTINSFLKAHGLIKGVFVPSSRISTIVGNLSTNDLKKLKLIGFDNTPQNIECLKNDLISFLISQKPFDQGYESIRLIADYLIKKKIPKNKVYLPIDILMKENVDYNEVNQFMFENEITSDTN